MQVPTYVYTETNIEHTELHDITYYDVGIINNHEMKKITHPTRQPSRVLCACRLVNCIKCFKACVAAAVCTVKIAMPRRFYNVILITNTYRVFYPHFEQYIICDVGVFIYRYRYYVRRKKTLASTVTYQKCSKKTGQVYYTTRIKSGRAPMVFDMLLVFFFTICCNLRRSCVKNRYALRVFIYFFPHGLSV